MEGFFCYDVFNLCRAVRFSSGLSYLESVLLAASVFQGISSRFSNLLTVFIVSLFIFKLVEV